MTTSPSIMLSCTPAPHASSLEFLLAWICILVLQCTSACPADELMEAMFSEYFSGRPEDLESKFVDYWYLSCFVAKVHWFVLSHLLGADEAPRALSVSLDSFYRRHFIPLTSPCLIPSSSTRCTLRSANVASNSFAETWRRLGGCWMASLVTSSSPWPLSTVG